MSSGSESRRKRIDKLRQQEEKQRQLNTNTDRRIGRPVSAIGKLIVRLPQAGDQPSRCSRERGLEFPRVGSSGEVGPDTQIRGSFHPHHRAWLSVGCGMREEDWNGCVAGRPAALHIYKDVDNIPNSPYMLKGGWLPAYWQLLRRFCVSCSTC